MHERVQPAVPSKDCCCQPLAQLRADACPRSPVPAGRRPDTCEGDGIERCAAPVWEHVACRQLSHRQRDDPKTWLATLLLYCRVPVPLSVAESSERRRDKYSQFYERNVVETRGQSLR